jgi:hypothetical protein
MVSGGELTQKTHAFFIINHRSSCGARLSKAAPEPVQESREKMSGTFQVKKSIV